MNSKRACAISPTLMMFFLCICCGCSVLQSAYSPDSLSEEEKQKIRDTFKNEIKHLQIAKQNQPEYRVLVVNWANFDNESPDYFKIVRGLADGGEIWLNGYAADAIDAEWKQFGNADYEGSLKIMPALINWVGSYGWRLIEVHDSQLSQINYPNKLYFVKKIGHAKKTREDD